MWFLKLVHLDPFDIKRQRHLLATKSSHQAIPIDKIELLKTFIGVVLYFLKQGSVARKRTLNSTGIFRKNSKLYAGDRN